MTNKCAVFYAKADQKNGIRGGHLRPCKIIFMDIPPSCC